MEQWDTIYKNSASKMLGVCRRYVKDSQQAEDLMHNAFMTAMSKADTYSGKGLFEGWLRKIVINTALLYLRKNKNAVISENSLVENYSEPVEEDEELAETQRNSIEEANFSQQELLEVIDQLPDHHKSVFNLYVIDGYKHKEIGKMLNISQGTSKSHLARARKKIQQLLFERAKNKDKKRGFFFLLFAKEDYIDKIYKDAFTAFEVPPQKQKLSDGGSAAINTTQKFSLIGNVISNNFLFVSLTALVVSGGIWFLFFSGPEKKSIQEMNRIDTRTNVIEPKTTIVLPSEADSTSAEPHLTNTSGKAEVFQPSSKANNSSVPQTVKVQSGNQTIQPTTNLNPNNAIKKTDSSMIKKPVVIHKKIIRHDTVIQKVPVQNEK